MSNLDPRPDETSGVAVARGPVVELLAERTVPLGGVRGTTVRRTLPRRGRPTVGAWCFLDEFGPVEGEPMRVLPHPHTGLQTVTWPLAGEIRHRDSLGSDVVVRPGELNLMTAGRGVAHSEISAGGGTRMHGLQLWVALPEHTRRRPARFEQHRTLPQPESGPLRATVLAGEFLGARSPAVVDTALVGVDIALRAGTVEVPLDPAYEHAVLAVGGQADVAGTPLRPGPLLYLGTGRDSVRLGSAGGAHLILLGGEPFDEDLVMWWNFVARSHDEIVGDRAEWEGRGDRFGTVAGHGTDRIPAPPLPGGRLRPRPRPTG